MLKRNLGVLALIVVAGVANATPYVSLFNADAVSWVSNVTIQRDGPTWAATPWVYGRVVIDVADSSTPNPMGYSVEAARLKGLINGMATGNLLCVEVNEGLVPGPTTYAKYYAYGRAGYLVNMLKDESIRNDRDAMAGLQLAMWEVAYDDTNMNPDNLLADRFKLNTPTAFNATARNYANSFLAASQGQAAGYYYYKNPIAGSTEQAGRQDLVSTVPSPAALIPFAVGLVSAMRRRRK